MDKRAALVALLDIYRTVDQPISFGYFEYGDNAEQLLINLGVMVCHGMPRRYLTDGPRTVMNAAQVWEMLNEGATAEQVVDAALAKLPAFAA